MIYKIMEPPFGSKGYQDMTEQEAKIHFDWYIKMIPKRLDMLKNAYKLKNQEDIFDFSSESLVPLWSWYLDNVNILPKSTDEYKREVQNMPDYMKINVPKEKVEIGWIQISLDIGIYFSECLLNHSPKLRWGFVTEPKGLNSVNRPVIMGFINDMDFDHTNIMSVATSKISRKASTDDALFQLFDIWLKFIPQ